MRQEDTLAALLFSSHTSAFGLAEYTLTPYNYDTDPIDKIVECCQLSRGINLVISPYPSYLAQTWLKSLFRTDVGEALHEDQIRATLTLAYPTYTMVRSLAFGQEDPERRKCCLDTTEDIFTFIGALTKHSEDYPTSAYLVDQWIVQLPPVFEDMLIERRPIALIILAHWAILTSINPRPWHLRGLSEVLTARIATVLEDEWAEFLRWPKERVIENASAIQFESILTPLHDKQGVEGQLDAMQLSHSSFSEYSTDDNLNLQPPAYSCVSSQTSSHGSNIPRPHTPTSDRLSPYVASDPAPEEDWKSYMKLERV